MEAGEVVDGVCVFLFLFCLFVGLHFSMAAIEPVQCFGLTIETKWK